MFSNQHRPIKSWWKCYQSLHLSLTSCVSLITLVSASNALVSAETKEDLACRQWIWTIHKENLTSKILTQTTQKYGPHEVSKSLINSRIHVYFKVFEKLTKTVLFSPWAISRLLFRREDEVKLQANKSAEPAIIQNYQRFGSVIDFLGLDTDPAFSQKNKEEKIRVYAK